MWVSSTTMSTPAARSASACACAVAASSTKTVPASGLEDHERRRPVLEPVRDLYDYILVDCPPSLGLLTINGLFAADIVLRDDRDPAVLDAHVGNTVEHGLRVHDPAVLDDDVVAVGRVRLAGAQEDEQKARRQQPERHGKWLHEAFGATVG